MKGRANRQEPDLCSVCGNELPPTATVCPFCESQRVFEPSRVTKTTRLVTINLKEGLPTVDQAMMRLDRELNDAIVSGAQVIRIIHGWGSSGKGGAIRDEVRRTMAVLQRNHRAGLVVHGEELGERTATGRQLLSAFPFLRDDRSNIGNPGITMVTFARRNR